MAESGWTSLARIYTRVFFPERILVGVAVYTGKRLKQLCGCRAF